VVPGRRSSFVPRISLLQVMLNRRTVVQPSGLQPVNEIAASQDNDGVPVFTDFSVCLAVEMRGGDQYAELAVPEP
jgi:hypothetical protein